MFLSPSGMRDTFAGYSSLGLATVSFQNLKHTVEPLLAFKVSIETLVLFMPLAAFNTFLCRVYLVF